MIRTRKKFKKVISELFLHPWLFSFQNSSCVVLLRMCKQMFHLNSCIPIFHSLLHLQSHFPYTFASVISFLTHFHSLLYLSSHFSNTFTSVIPCFTQFCICCLIFHILSHLLSHFRHTFTSASFHTLLCQTAHFSHTFTAAILFFRTFIRSIFFFKDFHNCKSHFLELTHLFSCISNTFMQHC